MSNPDLIDQVYYNWMIAMILPTCNSFDERILFRSLFGLKKLFLLCSAKEKGFYNGLRRKKARVVISMVFWKLIRLLVISILHLEKAFSNQMCMFMISLHSKKIVLM